MSTAIVNEMQKAETYLATALIPALHTKKHFLYVTTLIKTFICSTTLKGQPGARSSRLRRVRGRDRPLWVLCSHHFPAFLQEAVFRTWTHDLMVTRQQLCRCARSPLQFAAEH
jgi:hypothetical protein